VVRLALLLAHIQEAGVVYVGAVSMTAEDHRQTAAELP
jgi:hypothetical protein